MFAQLGAILAAVRSVVKRILGNRFRAIVGMTAATWSPADPNVPVAGVSYRSGIAPYTSMRPTAPSGWKEQNQRVTPTPKSEQ